MADDYTTVTTLKDYLHISGSADDTLLGELVTRASRMIDDHCGRWFKARTETRYYDANGSQIVGRLLLLDADLLTTTQISNGDGSTIASSDVLLRPINWPPFFGISLKQESGLAWTYTGSPEGAISISGTWGYAADPPEPIEHACVRLAAWLYRQRDTGGDNVDVEVSERGVSIVPARLPRDVSDMLQPYIRLRLKVYTGAD